MKDAQERIANSVSGIGEILVGYGLYKWADASTELLAATYSVARGAENMGEAILGYTATTGLGLLGLAGCLAGTTMMIKGGIDVLCGSDIPQMIEDYSERKNEKKSK